MKSDVQLLKEVLRDVHQWVIPIYQRHYEWDIAEDKQVPGMWADLREQVLGRLAGQSPYQHYFGAIMFQHSSENSLGMVHRRVLVDGQQRITSFHLAIGAIRETARRSGLQRVQSICDEYLINNVDASPDPERDCLKLWPSLYDRELYTVIAKDSWDEARERYSEHFHKNERFKLKQNDVPQMLKAYTWLMEKVEQFVEECSAEMDHSEEMVCQQLLEALLEGFRVVTIELSADDAAHEIFENLNRLGEPLTAFDLIRNGIFHRAQASGENIDAIFEEHWKRFEDPFWSEEVGQGRVLKARADHFLGHAVLSEIGEQINIGKLVLEYDRCRRIRAYSSISAELAVLNSHGDTYEAMERGDSGGTVSGISKLLQTWKWSTFHPLVFSVEANVQDGESRKRLYAFLEAFIVRREICGYPSGGYDSLVAELVGRMRESKGDIADVFDAIARSADDGAQMPSDEELHEAIIQSNAYKNIPAPRLRYILLELEHAMHTKNQERVVLDESLTAEHIMPQKWAPHWPLPDGTEAPCESPIDALEKRLEISEAAKLLMEERQLVVNTLGNLTLLTAKANLEASNKCWKEKKKCIKEYSLLAMNHEIIKRPTWSEGEILKRGRRLSLLAKKLWPAVPK